MNAARRSTLAFATVLVAALSIVPPGVLGQTRWPATVVLQPTSPIRLDACTLGTGIDATNLEHLTEFVSFTNVAKQDATGVEFRFDLIDDAGLPIDSVTGVMYGTYSPGAEIKPKTSIESVLPDRLGGVRCSVYDVRFADGSVWEAPTPAPVPSATASP